MQIADIDKAPPRAVSLRVLKTSTKCDARSISASDKVIHAKTDEAWKIGESRAVPRPRDSPGKAGQMTRKITIIAVSVLALCAFRSGVLAEDGGAASARSVASAKKTGGAMGRLWALGPFVKHGTPILKPNPEAKFFCPISKKTVKWEEQNVYNPAAVVRSGKVHLLYRADDKVKHKTWGRTCRTGLAVSADGRAFTRNPKPVLYPDNDNCKKYEWVGGVEDIHITQDDAGKYYVYYTAWTGKSDTMIVASSRSKNLRKWTKHGPAFGAATRAGKHPRVRVRTGVVVSRLEKGRLIAAKIKGKYWMYFGLHSLVATSDNLIDWTVFVDKDKKPVRAIPLRPGHFDSGCAEAGAIALLTDKGIVVMYNALNRADRNYPRGWSCLGQALMDKSDPTRLIDRLDKPFLHAEFEWELKGFCSPALVSNALVFFKGQWLLYYGAADRRIGLASFKPKP